MKKVVEQTVLQAVKEKGYVNGIICGRCGNSLGFLDEDIKWERGRKLKDGGWEIPGFIECPFCGTQILVEVDRTDILRRWIAAQYYTIYRDNRYYPERIGDKYR